MKRGEVYDARLEPTEGSEQGGTRPVIINIYIFSAPRSLFPTF